MLDALTQAIAAESKNGEMTAAATQCGLGAPEVAGTMIEALGRAQPIAVAGK